MTSRATGTFLAALRVIADFRAAKTGSRVFPCAFRRPTVILVTVVKAAITPPSRSGAGRLLGFILLCFAGALSAAAADFDFVVIGDTRPTFESENFHNFEQLIPKINAAKPALVINVGDLIYGYGPRRKEAQWDRYERVIHAFEVPYFQLPGNHDTHSRDARRVYGRRFGRFYQSFNHRDCHFVLLDNTEEGRWGYIGATELDWLKADLKNNKARQVFVFLHFPVWEPERVSPRAYEFWSQTLHPLFLSNRVTAVFGGHYHSYGPTREFDGIRYFITGGGGAELRPEYKRSGGEFHFMKVFVRGGGFDVRIVNQHGELTDAEADVMGGLQFADRNSSRIGLKRGSKELTEGVALSVVLNNPYREFMTGKATWLFDASAFEVEPRSVSLTIPAGGTQVESFQFRALRETATLQSLPRLEFDVLAGGHRHRFSHEVRFLDQVDSPFRRSPPQLDGDLQEWGQAATLTLNQGSSIQAEVRSCYGRENLYFAITVPTVVPQEDASSDDLQIGIARRLSETAFGSDFLRLGFNHGSAEARNRTPSQKRAAVVPGVRSASRRTAEQTLFEIAIPLRLLRHIRPDAENRPVVDLSYRVPANGHPDSEPANPRVNSFSYRVRYGVDALVPVYFVELNLGRPQ